MKVLLCLVLVTSIGIGCGSEPFRPELPHPTPDQMRALLYTPLLHPGYKNTQFELQVSRFVMYGTGVWITCYVPERYGTGRIRFGVEDVLIREGALDHTQNRLFVETLPCGQSLATCAISTSRNTQHRTADVTIEVRGGMCGGVK